MAFTAKKSDNSVAAVVNDYESVIVGGLQLLGYSYANYSEEIAQNFIKVAENFAHSVAPQAPMKGQLWYDTTAALQPVLRVCHNPNGAASPTTARWTTLFTIDAATGTTIVDAYTLRGYAPSTTTAAGTVVVRGNDGKIDSASINFPVQSTPSFALNDLTDVTIGSPTNGSVLKYNGTQWVVGTDNAGSGGATTLDGLSDVNTSGAATGSVLKFDGSNWVPGTDNAGSGGGGSVAWGGITGSLSSQTDLQTALNNKASSTHGHAISDITGLQSELNGKLTMAALLAADGAGSGIDADLLDGQDASYFLNLANHTGSLPDSSISTGSFGDTGYAKVGALWLQWGTFFVGAAANTNTVTLPIAFPTACLKAFCLVQGDPDFSNDESDEDFWAYPNGSTTSFTIAAQGDRNGVVCSWFAIGN